MIHKNLTPFFWGPRVTSRRPPQVEMAVCVRAVFRLVPGQPLEAIEDPMEQGFMSGDTFLPDDIDQKGALLYASDFAEWKLHSEMLLKGTCHPPGGSATSCNVRFAVGDWSKSLHVVGPRVFRPGMLMGGKTSDAMPFERMPLTWQNAYGGEGYAHNPVGRGFADVEMPTVEMPEVPVTKKGKGGIVPASFLPISPHWAQRAGKRGKKYDDTWKKTRAPFYAEDFDWTYFQSAPEDQRLDGYLRGDEDVVFENLHPAAAVWRTKLPGLRIRAFVKTMDEVVREPEMHLDTVYADLDAGKLYLTWRGLAPIREVDMTDVGAVLIASEPLAAAEKPFSDYEALLAEFEADPVGLKAAFPPGFMITADAIAAAELAERNGEPMPDLKAVAASLPPGCPFPPWFLAHVAGDPDPLGVKSKFPPGMLDGKLGVEGKIGDLGDKDKLKKALEPAPQAANDPAVAVQLLKNLAALMPPDKQAPMVANLDALQKQIANAKAATAEGGGESAMSKALAAKAGAPPAPSVPPAVGYAKVVEQTKSDLAAAAKDAAAAGGPNQPAVLARIQAGQTAANKMPTSLDDMAGKALAPLDALPLPVLPPIPDVEAQLAAERAKLEKQEDKMRGQNANDPMLAIFAMGHRLIDNAPRPEKLAPDMAPMVAMLKQTHGALSAQGISAAALAPLTRLLGKVEAIAAKLPQRPPAPQGQFAQQNLRGRDFSGQDLHAVVFARSDLIGANFTNADLQGANFTDCDLTGANFTDAKLTGADFSRAVLGEAVLIRVGAAQAVFSDAELSGADLSSANLEGARFEQARLVKAKLGDCRLVGANLQFADLSKTDLTNANLSTAQLALATLDLVRGDGANLSGTTFDMAKLTKSRFRNANLQNASSSMGSFGGSDLTGADLSGSRFEKVDFIKAVIDGANFTGAKLLRVNFRDVQAIGTNFRDADLTGASATGAAKFAKASFIGAAGRQSTWLDADLSGADLSRSTFANAYFQGIRGEDIDFEGAVLKGACFRRAELERPRFARADLSSADFNCAKLDDANFRGANCYDVKFLGAKAVRSDFAAAFVKGVQLDDPGVQRS